MLFLSKAKLQSKWILENKLLQKFPRLIYLEEQSKCKSLNQLNQILSYILVSGLHRNPFVMSRVLRTCFFGLEEECDGKLRRSYGTFIFSQIQQPNISSWNTMIRASAEPEPAFGYYREMLRCGVYPDKHTYPTLLQACETDSDVGLLKQVHSHALMFGFEYDLYVQNSFLHLYIAFGSVLDGRKLFDEMIERDVVSWTTLVSSLVNQGFYDEGLLVFNRMMVDESNICPNVVTVVSVMSACANLGSLYHTRAVHAYLCKTGWVEVNVTVRNSLIDAYSKCGSIHCAHSVFYEMQCSPRDTYSWTTMIAGLAMHGRGTEAVRLFLQMKQVVGVVPDPITFITVLSACAHAGLVDEGVEIFELMREQYGIVPELQHYGCMVDLFGRAGLLEYAYGLIETMPLAPNLAILGSLLSACRLHNNVDMGEVILEKINSSCDYKGGANVLLSNMYAGEKQWCEVVKVRKGVEEGDDYKKKPPGQSWIEVKDSLHEFRVGDKSNPELYGILDGLQTLLLSAVKIHHTTD